MKARVAAVAESKWFRGVVMALIGLNSLTIAAETYPGIMAKAGRALHAADRIILAIFVAELLIRFMATSPMPKFFVNGWNLFDVIVVGAGFIEGIEFLSVLRLLRIIRILRAVTFIPQLQKLVLSLLRSLPSMAHILLLLSLLFFAYGAAGTYLFRDADPQHFGTFHDSLLTLFGVLTLEGWVAVQDGVLQAKPLGWIYFVSFILLGTFITMNLLVGVIVNNMQKDDSDREIADDKLKQEKLDRILTRLDQLVGKQ